MDLHSFVAVARKRWISIAAFALLGAIAGFAVAATTTPIYTATTQLYVSVQGGDTTSDLLQGSNFTQQQVSSYTKIVTSPLVLDPVIDQLGLAERAEELAKSVSADTPLNTSLINVSVEAANPAIAAATADAIAAQFKQVIGDLETPTNGESSAVKVSVVRPATAPTQPSSPRIKLDIALGLLLGLAVGVATAVARELLDTRVRNTTDVGRVTAVSVIGNIAYDEDAANQPLIVQSHPHSHRSEAFRRLRTNLQFLDIADRPHSVIVTSSIPGEGKSTTAINVAITLADAGSRVALVDADLRRPAVAKYMGLEGSVGLTTVLIGRAAIEDVIQPWGSGMLHVLPSGQVPPNPSELLGSQSMANVLERLTESYDMVVVDTPPLLPVTDAAILSKLTGGALVVVGADKLHRNQLAESINALETVGARILGIVLNRQARKQSEAYQYYEYAPGSARPTGGRSSGSGRGRKKSKRAASRPRTSATGTPVVRTATQEPVGPGQPQGASFPRFPQQ